MNFNKNPLQCISFEKLDNLNVDVDLNTHTVQSIAAAVADMTDKAIVDAIVDTAKKEGIDNLYLMDKTFIKNALEKQIPKKPYKRQNDYYCTVCRRYLGDKMELKHACLQPEYCPHCGQALDWSDTE